MSSVPLDDLNPAQRAAVLAGDGPILILAGAGSGKTRTITYRIAHLLAERKAQPGEVMAVTFTNKAAAEMRERVAVLLGNATRFPLVSTFHSACARILRLEISALERLAEEGQLAAYRHDHFWQCMDTLRDKRQLEAL